MSNNSAYFEMISIRSRNLFLNVSEATNIDELMADNDNSNLIQGYSEIQNINTFNLSEDESKWRYVFSMLLGTRVIPLDDSKSDDYANDKYEAPFSITSLVELVYESSNEVEFLDESANFEFYPLKEAWPFWIDLVHSTCLRAGYYPPIKILNTPPSRPVYTSHDFHHTY